MGKTLDKQGKRKIEQFVRQWFNKYVPLVEAVLSGHLPPSAFALAVGVSDRKWKDSSGPFTDVQNDKFSDYRGSRMAGVKLHPHTSIGMDEPGDSDADASVPEALADLQKLMGSTTPLFTMDTFVSGHVMNAHFGGSGNDPNNQTILTSNANSTHKTWEKNVKMAHYYMSKVMGILWNHADTPERELYLEGLQKTWTIDLVGTVGNRSWYDVLSANASVDQVKVGLHEDILKSIATDIDFTANASGTPTLQDIAKFGVSYDSGSLSDLIRFHGFFESYMGEVSHFELSQVPADFGARTAVSSAAPDASGTMVKVLSRASTSTTAPKPKAARARRAAPKGRFTFADGTSIDFGGTATKVSQLGDVKATFDKEQRRAIIARGFDGYAGSSTSIVSVTGGPHYLSDGDGLYDASGKLMLTFSIV